jgi:hypothetical protein
MAVHELKIDPAVFEEIWQGRKLFEIRFNDRDYRVFDELQLRETKYSGEQMINGKPLLYTGRRVYARVPYALYGPAYGLIEGWVIMSLTVLSLGSIKQEFRRDGTTSEQMRLAPLNAFYIWPSKGCINYAYELARHLGRDDLHIVSPSWLTSGQWHGIEITGIVVDHACELNRYQLIDLEAARVRIR